MDKTVIYKLPYHFLCKLEKLYPQEFDQILETFSQPRKTTFRINFLKTDLISLREALNKAHIRYQELDYPKGAFICQTPLRELQNTNLYLMGWIYVQNVSSMLPVTVLDPKDNEEILDVCAAPGAKASQILSVAPQARLTAMEKNRVRFYKLMTNLKGQGCGNLAKVVLADGETIRKRYPETFDRILVDAPCSTEGRFSTLNPKTYFFWKPKKVDEMVRTQKKLMNAAFFALKPGGTLVYSTCTFSPEENEGVASWFVEKFKNKVVVENINLNLTNIKPGITCFDKEKYSGGMSLACRVLPNDYMEGFFVIKIKKIEE